MPNDHTLANAAPTQLANDRPLVQAIIRGATGRCPSCGKATLFLSYLKVHDRCPACTQEWHHQRADDAPPYVVIMIAGHLVVGAALTVEAAYGPPLWMQMIGWPLLALALSLALLPPVKGALIGLQWALRMHGFGLTNPTHER
jgi:uncharacterized protein (DUF983 family)